jgi:hypothetical protein
VAAIERPPTTHLPTSRPGTSITVNLAAPELLVRLLAVLMAPAMVGIMGVDLRLRGSEGMLVHGGVDWTAHLLTALIIFAAIRALGFPVNWLMAAFGSVVVDADYLLMHEGMMGHAGNVGRGILHTPGPALALIVIGLLVPPARVFFLSLGIGMLTHILRDSATAETALLWPLSDRVFHLRYILYLTILAAFTVVATGIVALGARPLRD